MSASEMFSISNATREDKGWIILALGWSQTGIATIVVILRFYTRYLMRGIVIEDWLMLIALVRTQLEISHSFQVQYGQIKMLIAL